MSLFTCALSQQHSAHSAVMAALKQHHAMSFP